MAVERTIRLAIALGREPMRRWERDAITAALRVEGVVFVGCTQEEMQRADRAALRPSWLFGKYLAQQAASDGLLGVAKAPNELGMTRSRDQQALPDVILCLCGETGAHVQRIRDAEVWAFRNADAVPPNPIPPGIRESFHATPSSHFELFDLTTERALRTGCFRERTTLRHAPSRSSKRLAPGLRKFLRNGSVDLSMNTHVAMARSTRSPSQDCARCSPST
jgi:hypothetical protein